MANITVGSLVANNLLPIQARGAGQLSFGPQPIPAGFTILAVMFDLQQVSSLTAVLTAAVEMSTDNGATFVSAGGSGLDLSQSGYVLNGSVLTRPAGDFYGPGPVRIFGQFIQLRNSDLSTRQLRGTLSSTEALTSGVTLVAW